MIWVANVRGAWLSRPRASVIGVYAPAAAAAAVRLR
jgi:hypothetical protein